MNLPTKALLGLLSLCLSTVAQAQLAFEKTEVELNPAAGADSAVATFNYQNKGVSVVKQILAFIQKSLQEGKKVLISCDQGQSRSPSIAMLYLAKVLHTIRDTTFAEAVKEFVKIYPQYQPALGISTFLTEHWTEI